MIVDLRHHVQPARRGLQRGGGLEFGDGRGACGRDCEQNVRREIVDAVAACVLR
ncbi:hypothetical protein [Bradyrhizobium sp. LCT2]|uniref:hypothetical protein n=1 Tax=Bradyrhizobium sp. LCT2 TaxID=2493093 RepID=UPI00137531FB|nr:hypothetical protein [Bradyrhizobium sp. LCT2]